MKIFLITEHRSGLNNPKNCLGPTNNNTATPMLHHSDHTTYTAATWLQVLTRGRSPKRNIRTGIQEYKTQEK
jgi:hypothetical protein